MSAVRTLRGGCACGRNEFVIRVPATSIDQLQVLFDNSNRTRRHTTTPFTPFLRVPLDWYHSITYAFFPDETHRSIRRTFSSPHDGPQAQRHFCGYCGTPLSAWNERTNDDAQHIEVTLGSLIDEDVRRLRSWNLLRTEDDSPNEPYDDLEEEEQQQEDTEEQDSQVAMAPGSQIVRGMVNRGTPWFEAMIENSALGRIRRRKGGYQAPDGSESLYWEVVELDSNGAELPTEQAQIAGSAKRKREEVEEATVATASGDVHMRD